MISKIQIYALNLSNLEKNVLSPGYMAGLSATLLMIYCAAYCLLQFAVNTLLSVP